jgi:hypothetical protein
MWHATICDCVTISACANVMCGVCDLATLCMCVTGQEFVCEIVGLILGHSH